MVTQFPVRPAHPSQHGSLDALLARAEAGETLTPDVRQWQWSDVTFPFLPAYIGDDGNDSVQPEGGPTSK
jgi:hypothetical protein